MFAALFVLIVVGSLFTSGLLFFEVLPASPEVLMIIVGAHAVFAIGFFHAYSKYRALHRLVLEGRGELFDMAILAQIRSSRFRGWKDHYRLRRIQGLQLSGLPAQALKAARGREPVCC